MAVHIRTSIHRMACGARLSSKSAYTGTHHAATCKKCLERAGTPKKAAIARLNGFVSDALEAAINAAP